MEPNDDGLSWGFLDENGNWRELPKLPMILAGLGPPPFFVTLPIGIVRQIIYKPEVAEGGVLETQTVTGPI